MSFRKFLPFLCLTLIVGESYAWVYVDTPPGFKENPNPIECREVLKHSAFEAKVVHCPNNVNSPYDILIAEDDGSDVRVRREPKGDMIQCVNGYCRDSGDRFLGRYEIEGQNRVEVYLPNDYYITRDSDSGKPYAYQYGTGPLADTISRPWIAEEAGEFPMGKPYQGQVQSTSGNNGGRWTETYDLWCSPQLVECAGVNGKAILREDLPDHYPIVDVPNENGDDYYCSLETCHRKSDDEVIGLNPFYHLWD